MKTGRTRNKVPGQGWTALFLSGIGVAAFTFAAPIVWQKLSHRNLGPAYVETALRAENGVLMLMVRNNSDDPLDLVAADVEIAIPKRPAVEFGAYPELSHLYAVNAQASAELKQTDDRLLVKLRIAQSIKPGHLDQFGFSINGPGGSLMPQSGSLHGSVTDIKGNVYPIKY